VQGFGQDYETEVGGRLASGVHLALASQASNDGIGERYRLGVDRLPVDKPTNRAVVAVPFAEEHPHTCLLVNKLVTWVRGHRSWGR
jgi:hypothetical protein